MRTKHVYVLIHIRIKADSGIVGRVWALWYFFTDRSNAVLLLWIRFVICVSRLSFYYSFLSVPSSLAITCLERADLLALLCVMFFVCFVTFPYRVSGQVCYLIVSIPELCLLLYF